MLKNIILATALAFSTSCCCAAEKLETIKFRDRNVCLYGDCLDNGYCHNLVLEMERENMAPERVDLNLGGYWPEMLRLCLRPGEEQLLCQVRQGGHMATTEYRILALRKGVRELPKRSELKKEIEKLAENEKKNITSAKDDKPVQAAKGEKKAEPKSQTQTQTQTKPVERDILKQIFANTESMGLIQEVCLGEKSLTVCLLDGTRQTIPLADKIWDRIENFYNRGYEPDYKGLVSLVAYDVDKDGVDELYAAQRMELNATDLGYVAARLTLQKDDSWKMTNYVLQMPSVPKDGDAINQGLENDFYQIYTERIYLPKCQGAYPRFYCKSRVLMDKIDAAFAAEYAGDLETFFGQNAPMGFEVIISYEKILSLRFIGGTPRRNHFLHLDPRNGNKITLKNMFTINSGFLKRISQLSPSKHKYVAKDLENWYMKDTSLYIVLNGGDKQRAEQFKLGAFEEFLNPKNEILHVNEKKEK